jgi:hypothetical protein
MAEREMYTKTQLKSRGWNEDLINRLLKEPDETGAVSVASAIAEKTVASAP